MYQKNDYINYAGHGICKIEDIRRMNFHTGSGEQDYYVIQPIAPGSATIYLPVDSPKSADRMRPILTQAEIDSVIRSVGDEEIPWPLDRKARQARFQEIISRRDERELMLLASCLHRQLMAKGLSTGDRDTLRKVESIIEQEFSFSLQISASSIGEYIREKLGEP